MRRGRRYREIRGDRLIHATLVAGTFVALALASVIVILFTGFPAGPLAIGTLVGTAVMATVGWRVISAVGSGVGHMLTASGVHGRSREYSEQEALEIRGAHREAADSYRSHLVAFPDDQEARLRLAALLHHRLADHRGAEALYLAVRAAGPTRAQQVVIGNGLIDLHRATGDGAGAEAELQRFAREFAGTPVGAGARDALRRGGQATG